MILFRYNFMRYLAMFARVALIFASLLLVIGVVDELGALKGDQGISRAAYLAFIGQMGTFYTILPLLALISAVAMFMGMSRSSEIVAIRASGQSGLSYLIAPSLAAFLIGLLALVLLNPLVTVMTTQFSIEKGLAQPSAAVTLDGSGLWLRQGNQAEQTIIFAKSSNIGQLVLKDATFMVFDENGTPLRRIEAGEAQLVPKAWVLSQAMEWNLAAQNPQLTQQPLPPLTRLATDILPKDITSGFGLPNSVPIYALPAHIASLEKAGFSAVPFRVWLQAELAKPIALAVMVLVAAGFTMRHIRSGNRAQMVLYAVLLGFGLFFLRNMAQVLGQNGFVPAALAAWGPILAAFLLAFALLLHLEEG